MHSFISYFEYVIYIRAPAMCDLNSGLAKDLWLVQGVIKFSRNTTINPWSIQTQITVYCIKSHSFLFYLLFIYSFGFWLTFASLFCTTTIVRAWLLKCMSQIENINRQENGKNVLWMGVQFWWESTSFSEKPGTTADGCQSRNQDRNKKKTLTPFFAWIWELGCYSTCKMSRFPANVMHYAPSYHHTFCNLMILWFLNFV